MSAVWFAELRRELLKIMLLMRILLMEMRKTNYCAACGRQSVFVVVATVATFAAVVVGFNVATVRKKIATKLQKQ